MKKLFPLVLILLIVSACGSSKKPEQQQYTSEDSLTCQFGEEEAERDFQAGRLLLNAYGMPGPQDEFYWQVLKDDYNIGIKRSYGCVIDGDHVECYNNVMKQRIKEKLGPDVFMIANTKADSLYEAAYGPE